MKVFYKHLDAKYNISLGKSLIGFSNTRQLEELAALDLPYLEDYREDINQCLNESVGSKANHRLWGSWSLGV